MADASQPRVRRTLVVAAVRAEAAHLPAGTPLVLTGIGKTPAAVAVTRALAALDDPADWQVVNLGTAGALRDDLSGLHEVATVVNHDINADAIRALGYDPGERIDLPGVTGGVTLASGDVFVTEPAVRDRLAATADLVDMEGYAVAYACRVFGVPVRLIKHVSDSADESAHDWPAMVDRSARVLADWFTTHSML